MANIRGKRAWWPADGAPLDRGEAVTAAKLEPPRLLSLLGTETIS